jgi:hypothetical protein
MQPHVQPQVQYLALPVQYLDYLEDFSVGLQNQQPSQLLYLYRHQPLHVEEEVQTILPLKHEEVREQNAIDGATQDAVVKAS